MNVPVCLIFRRTKLITPKKNVFVHLKHVLNIKRDKILLQVNIKSELNSIIIEVY
jgi:hypothetical protein